MVEDNKQSEYNSSQFIVKDENDSELTIKQIIDSIEDVAPQVDKFTISGMSFIVVTGENIIINWSVLELIDSTECLIIELVNM